jgi:hypothetical protein
MVTSTTDNAGGQPRPMTWPLWHLLSELSLGPCCRRPSKWSLAPRPTRTADLPRYRIAKLPSTSPLAACNRQPVQHTAVSPPDPRHLVQTFSTSGKAAAGKHQCRMAPCYLHNHTASRMVVAARVWTLTFYSRLASLWTGFCGCSFDYCLLQPREHFLFHSWHYQYTPLFSFFSSQHENHPNNLAL